MYGNIPLHGINNLLNSYVSCYLLQKKNMKEVDMYLMFIFLSHLKFHMYQGFFNFSVEVPTNIFHVIFTKEINITLFFFLLVDIHTHFRHFRSAFMLQNIPDVFHTWFTLITFWNETYLRSLRVIWFIGFIVFFNKNKKKIKLKKK